MLNAGWIRYESECGTGSHMGWAAAPCHIHNTCFYSPSQTIIVTFCTRGSGFRLHAGMRVRGAASGRSFDPGVSSVNKPLSLEQVRGRMVDGFAHGRWCYTFQQPGGKLGLRLLLCYSPSCLIMLDVGRSRYKGEWRDGFAHGLGCYILLYLHCTFRNKSKVLHQRHG